MDDSYYRTLYWLYRRGVLSEFRMLVYAAIAIQGGDVSKGYWYLEMCMAVRDRIIDDRFVNRVYNTAKNRLDKQNNMQ